MYSYWYVLVYSTCTVLYIYKEYEYLVDRSENIVLTYFTMQSD